MGVTKVTNPLSSGVRKRYMENNCIECEDFLKKQEHAEQFLLMGLNCGVWDFDTCHATCWKDLRVKQNITNLNYYRRKNGLVSR